MLNLLTTHTGKRLFKILSLNVKFCVCEDDKLFVLEKRVMVEVNEHEEPSSSTTENI